MTRSKNNTGKSQNQNEDILQKIYSELSHINQRYHETIKSLSSKIEDLNLEINELKTHIMELKDNKYKQRNKDQEIEHPNKAPTLSYNKMWSNHLSKRKISYYKKIRSEGIATIYRQFLENNPPIIPKKFREKEFPGQSADHKKRLEGLQVTRMEIEIERLEEQSSKEETNIENVEKEINTLILTLDTPEERQREKERWLKEIYNEEKKSKTIWNNKEGFFKNVDNNKHYEHRSQSQNNQRNKKYNGYYSNSNYKYNFSGNNNYQNNEYYNSNSHKYNNKQGNSFLGRGRYRNHRY